MWVLALSLLLFQLTSAQDDCACGPGEFALNGACEPCPWNSAQAPDSGDTCLCWPGYYDVGTPEAFAEVDPAGFLDWTLGNPETPLDMYCARCPAGAHCIESGITVDTVTPAEDYFMGLDNSGLAFFPCFNEACDGGGTCAEGYEGQMCTNCSGDNTLLSDYTCSDCSPSGWAVPFFLIDLGLFVAVMVHYYRSIGITRKQLHSSYLKILLSFCQVNVLVIAFQFDLGSQVDFIYTTMREVISTGFAWVEYQCVFKSDTTSPFVINSLVLMALPAFLCLIWAAVLYLLELCRNSGATEPLQGKEEDDGQEATGKVFKAYLSDILLCMGSVLFFYLYPILAEQSALVFSCQKLGMADNDWFLTQDLSIQCWDTNHWLLIFLVWVPMMTLYTVGVPVLVLYMLRQNQGLLTMLAAKKRIPSCPSSDDAVQEAMTALEAELGADGIKEMDCESQAFLIRFGFYFVGYAQETIWWEAVVFARKASMIVIACTFNSDAFLQSMAGVAVMTIAVFLHLKFMPFSEKHLGNYELCSLLCTLCLYFFGALTSGPSYYHDWAQVATLITTSVFYVYTVLFALYIAKLECEELGLLPQYDEDGNMIIDTSNMKSKASV